ncbi:MAG: hypothetical protein R3F20_16245 [Planctomycetota bacterium]
MRRTKVMSAPFEKAKPPGYTGLTSSATAYTFMPSRKGFSEGLKEESVRTPPASVGTFERVTTRPAPRPSGTL